ncbi:MAG: hypothetical protein WBD20_07090 [Pirellulaceae bacterium]
MIQKRFSLICVFAVLASVGCEQRFDATYGNSTGISGRVSVNGFGALRNSFENAGYDTLDVRRLTERTRKSDVIVWTPTVMTSTESKVTRWFESWLRRGEHTLVYIVPDSGSEASYWLQAGQSAPPDQRMEYRRRAARKLNERLQWTINRRASFTNGWFVVKPKSEIFYRGELTATNWDLSSQAADSEATRSILTEYVIEPYEEPKPSTPTPNAAAAAPPIVVNNGPTGPAAPYTPYEIQEVTKTKVEFDSLVKTESGETIVAEIRSDKWPKSKIIVVAGGSLLTNFAFTQNVNADLADQLIAHCVTTADGADSANPKTAVAPSTETDEQIAGFLLSSYDPIPVSERKAGVPQASGMELLTVWPLSLVTIHVALLGFVVCMILLPIFGRARNVDRGSSSHFGDHLDAVANLMSNSRGEKYARSRISEYMRRVKGETQGEWVLPDPPKAPIVPHQLPKPVVKSPFAEPPVTQSTVEPPGEEL